MLFWERMCFVVLICVPYLLISLIFEMGNAMNQQL